MTIARVAPYTIPVTDWQWQLDDFTFGAGTSFAVEEVTGLGLPATRSADSPRSQDDGSFGSQDTAAPRDITFRLMIQSQALRGDPALWAMLTTLRRAFRRRSADVPLAVQIPGFAQIVMLGRPRHLDFPFDRSSPIRDPGVEVMAQFTALDPLLYSGAVQDAPILEATAGVDAGWAFGVYTGAPSNPLGMSFGALTGTHPLGESFGSDTVGGVGSGFFTAVNPGTEATNPVTTIFGPADTPWISLVETGQFLQFNIVLGASDFLEIDHDLHSIFLNGVSNRQSVLDPSSSWWALAPGNNTIHYRTVGPGAGSSADVKWRNAWW